MKKLNLILVFASFIFGMFSSVPVFAQDSAGNDTLWVYILDYDGPFTNLRDKPKGAVIGRISIEEYVVLGIDRVENGWWHVVRGEVELVGADEPTVYNDGVAWIHQSVLGMATRNYAGQKLTLRAAPSDTAKAVYSFTDEIQVRPLAIDGEWVKVRTLNGKHTGWIKVEWLCGNPVSNCC